ncbi:hypothetical protein OFC13_28755, partial [Escherichia coli]|nr:hypothetical protein [Escherichia coli]
NCFEMLAYKTKRFAEPLFERALQLFVNRLSHFIELFFIAFAKAVYLMLKFGLYFAEILVGFIRQAFQLF